MGNLIGRLNKYRQRMKTITDVFEGRCPKVLIIGLDGSGKTAVLYKSKLDDTIYANAVPRGVNIEHMRPKRGARIQVIDLPGNKTTRYLWHDWFYRTEALVFVVDSADQVRVDEAKFELHDLIQSRDLLKVPLIIVANKQDSEGAMSTDVVSAELDLSSIEDRDWSIHATSAKTGSGIKIVFSDVVEKIKAYRHYKSGLGSPLRETNSVKKAKKIEDDKEPQFTSIEDNDTDANDNIPSLFNSLKRKEQVTDLDAVSDAIPSTSTTSSEQPQYARPTEEQTENIILNSEDKQSVEDTGHPSPDTVSETTRSVEIAQIEQNECQLNDRVDTVSNTETIADSAHSENNQDEGGTNKDISGSTSGSAQSEDSDCECVHHLEDIVKEEEMTSDEK